MPEISAAYEKVEAVDTAPEAPAGNKRRIDRLDDLIGLESQKETLRELVQTIRTVVKHRGKGALKNLNTNILISGPSGTGKTALIMAVAEYLIAENIFEQEDGQAFTATSLVNINLEENPAKAVFIDDAQRNFGNDSANPLVGTPLEYVFEKSKVHFALQDYQFIVVVSGDVRFQELVDSKPELKGLFAVNLRLPEYTPVEVAQICKAILLDKHKMDLADDAFEKLIRIFNYERRNSDNFGNAHLANAKA
ncbi:MAG: Flp pilus assembly complex ATPase component TadA, partial [Paramuribaculum sp.]|nr:Flp pilus assembly complex ATPase component TadA [Paramuribaculum sp.]